MRRDKGRRDALTNGIGRGRGTGESERTRRTRRPTREWLKGLINLCVLAKEGRQATDKEQEDFIALMGTTHGRNRPETAGKRAVSQHRDMEEARGRGYCPKPAKSSAAKTVVTGSTGRVGRGAEQKVRGKEGEGVRAGTEGKKTDKCPKKSVWSVAGKNREIESGKRNSARELNREEARQAGRGGERKKAGDCTGGKADSARELYRGSGYGDRWEKFERDLDGRLEDALGCPDVGMGEALELARREFVEVLAEEGAGWKGVGEAARKLRDWAVRIENVNCEKGRA